MEPGREIQTVGSIAQACRLLPYSTPIYQKRALFARAACPFPMGQNLPPVQKYMAGGASPWAQNGSALPTAGSWREGRRSRRGKAGVVHGECALRVWRFLSVGTSEMGAQSCKGYPCAFRRQSAANFLQGLPCIFPRLLRRFSLPFGPCALPYCALQWRNTEQTVEKFSPASAHRNKAAPRRRVRRHERKRHDPYSEQTVHYTHRTRTARLSETAPLT